MDTKTYLFEYEGVEFAIVKSGDISYFEGEILVDNESEIDAALKKIKDVCSELELDVFEEDAFMEMMNKLNCREGRVFDMREDKFEDIKNRFADFF